MLDFLFRSDLVVFGDQILEAVISTSPLISPEISFAWLCLVEFIHKNKIVLISARDIAHF